MRFGLQFFKNNITWLLNFCRIVKNWLFFIDKNKLIFEFNSLIFNSSTIKELNLLNFLFWDLWKRVFCGKCILNYIDFQWIAFKLILLEIKFEY